MATTERELMDAQAKADRNRARKLDLMAQWLAEVAAKHDLEERTAEALMLEAQGYAERRIAREDREAATGGRRP